MAALQVTSSGRVIKASDWHLTDLDSVNEPTHVIQENQPDRKTVQKKKSNLLTEMEKNIKKNVENMNKGIVNINSIMQKSMKSINHGMKKNVGDMEKGISSFLSDKPPEDLVIEDDQTFYVTEEDVREMKSRTCAGRTLSMSPETTMMIFDILFFSTYAVGWIVTLIFNYPSITDNAVTRMTGTYNICIGVDTYPARYLSIPMSYCFTIAYALTVALFMKRMLDQRAWHKRMSKIWRTMLLVVAMVLFLCFTWTIGVMPEDAQTFRVHMVGFLCALSGYSLIKLISIIEFGFFADEDDKEKGLSCKDMCHTWRKCVFLTFESGCSLVLGFSCVYITILYWDMLFVVPVEQVAAMLNTTIPTDTKLSYNTMPVLFFTAVCPIVARIIDPHRRHITITFKYQHPSEMDDGGIEGRKCQDPCLDSPIPCNCCWKEDPPVEAEKNIIKEVELEAVDSCFSNSDDNYS